MKTLQEFLQENESAILQEKERRQQREDWLASIQRLYDQFLAWLKEADTKGVLEILPSSKFAYEQALGRYEVPTLEILLGAEPVKIEPWGRNARGSYLFRDTVGSWGEGMIRVGKVGQNYYLHRVLTDGQERWYVADERRTILPLDKTNFEKMMLDLLS